MQCRLILQQEKKKQDADCGGWRRRSLVLSLIHISRAAYRQKHESDFIIADAAARYFREHGIKKLPTYKSLQAEIEQLTADKNARYNDYREKKERVRELQTVKGNIDQMMRGAPSQQKRHEHDR